MSLSCWSEIDRSSVIIIIQIVKRDMSTDPNKLIFSHCLCAGCIVISLSKRERERDMKCFNAPLLFTKERFHIHLDKFASHKTLLDIPTHVNCEEWYSMGDAIKVGSLLDCKKTLQKMLEYCHASVHKYKSQSQVEYDMKMKRRNTMQVNAIIFILLVITC